MLNHINSRQINHKVFINTIGWVPHTYWPGKIIQTRPREGYNRGTDNKPNNQTSEKVKFNEQLPIITESSLEQYPLLPNNYNFNEKLAICTESNIEQYPLLPSNGINGPKGVMTHEMEKRRCLVFDTNFHNNFVNIDTH